MKQFGIIISVIFLFCLTNCRRNSNDNTVSFIDFMHGKYYKTDTTEFVPYDSIFVEYDTIPVEYGYLLFDKIITPNRLDTSKFMQTWGHWDIDTIKTVLVHKSNIRVDPFKQLSDNSYFFIILFKEKKDKITIAATIYLDFDNDMIGEYTIDANKKIKYFEIDNHKMKIKKLQKLMRLNKITKS